ncbi:YciI family protein [Thalassotalea sp. HSM 43]|uniref:YciI family protein n=1 Tax=Thalassotalea sp. HSM 43 TaxID=2552945 RepID=UPI0010820B25|nr:YciI family protein [Thalassotalea sp. HSM 43]QBY04574.1 YciI family protein [Thalassotalea sp. HSM 43]
MLVSFICRDKNNQHSQQQRQQKLTAHLKWVEQHMDIIRVAGPLLHNDSQDYQGSFYILEADSLDSAWQVFISDPYYQAQIWQSVTHQEYKAYAGTWVGGKNWPGSS